MKRWLGILILSILLPSVLWAAEDIPFRYHIEESQKPSVFEYYQMSPYFETEGFNSLYDGTLATNFLFDKAFVSSDLEKAFLLKSGLRVDKSLQGKIFKDEASQTYAVHFEINSVNYLMLGVGLSEEEMLKVTRKIIPGLKKEASFIPMKKLLKWGTLLYSEEASANSCDYRAKAPTRSLQETQNFLEDNEIIKGIGRCAMTSFNELKDSIKDRASFFRKLAADPRMLWQEMKQSYVQFRELVLNIRSEVRQMLVNLQNLTPEQKVQLACSMAGVAMGVVVKSVLGGASSLLTSLPQVTLKLKSISALIGKTKGLGKFGLGAKDQNLIAERVLSCAR